MIHYDVKWLSLPSTVAVSPTCNTHDLMNVRHVEIRKTSQELQTLPCQVQSPRQLRPFFGSEKYWKRLKKIKQNIKYSSTGLKAPGCVEMTLLPLSRLGILSEWGFNICIFFENNLIDCSWKERFIVPGNMVGRPRLILVETAPQLVLRKQSLSVLRPFEAWNCKLRPASNISFVLEQNFFARPSKSHEAHLDFWRSSWNYACPPSWWAPPWSIGVLLYFTGYLVSTLNRCTLKSEPESNCLISVNFPYQRGIISYSFVYH